VKVLVVDDEPVVLAIVSAILMRAGYEVIEAADAKSALRLCEEHKEELGLVISDVCMPGMTGTELSKCLIAKYRTLPVILISGYHEGDPLVKRQFEEGRYETSRFLPKPFTPKELEAILEVLAKIPSRVPD
jgi:two-component system, cell cycle sensor histidine kinase and response regulator CckA